MGAALGAERVVSGSISRFGAAVTINLALIHTNDVVTEARASVTWPGAEDGLPQAVRCAAQRLTITASNLSPGALVLSPATDDAEVFVDGRLRGTVPLKPLEGLEVGVHVLNVRAPDHRPLELPFVVEHKKDTVVDATLIAIENDTPLYAAWWLWTIVAAVVAGGGVTAGVLIADGAHETKSVPVGTVELSWTVPDGS